MNFFKALIPSSILTWLGASLIGRNGSRGEFFNIDSFMLQGHEVHWS